MYSHVSLGLGKYPLLTRVQPQVFVIIQHTRHVWARTHTMLFFSYSTNLILSSIWVMDDY